MTHLDTLNQAQKEAVQTTEGPLLILAGAGAGKTRVIVHRILHLIERGVAPERILAVTFTNKAAKEMRERVTALVRETKNLNRPMPLETMPFVSTFHSLGVHILKENSRLLNIPRHFGIFDRTDSLRAVKEALVRAGYDPKETEPRKVLGTISRQKGEGTTVNVYREAAESGFYPDLVASVWEHYEKILAEEKVLDFDALLLKTARLLSENEAVRSRYQDAWEYIHVDEYQDTNKVQSQIAELLAAPKNNLCVVGDIDQTIYSWRGARLANVLHFEKTYSNAKIVILEENYRSSKHIIHASNEIIKKNKYRKEKTLYTNNPEGELLSLYVSFNENDEAQFVTDTVEEMRQKGTEPREIAVLYRANFQSRVLEEAFLEKNIPYQVLGVRFFERKEIKDTLAYLKAALNPESFGDVKRAVNAPPRGIGKTTLLRLAAGEKDKLPPAMKEKISSFYRLLSDIHKTALSQKPSETLKFIIQSSGMEKMMKEGNEDDMERLENIKELVTLAAKYDVLPPEEGIEKLLEDAALASDQDELKEDKNAVRLMTVHASKGLEFDAVFITGLEDGLFPHEKDVVEKEEDAEEERRLFYVALTRARKKVYLSYAGIRTIFGAQRVNAPSEFILDLPEESLEPIEPGGTSQKVIYLE